MEKSKIEALEKLDALLNEMSEEKKEKIICYLAHRAEISQTQQSL